VIGAEKATPSDPRDPKKKKKPFAHILELTLPGGYLKVEVQLEITFEFVATAQWFKPTFTASARLNLGPVSGDSWPHLRRALDKWTPLQF